jgi:biotin carboxyl carrier protein
MLNSGSPAEVAGRVWKLAVPAGNLVGEGQVLAILES